MEEIKAGGIMLGNWFIGYNGKPFQWDAECFYLTQGVVSTNELINKPIPLTEDILLKAGFIIGGYNLVEVTHPNYPRLFFVIMDDEASIGWNYNVSGTIKECEDSMIEIKYLHQLQNLFKSLTKTDLKIEV